MTKRAFPRVSNFPQPSSSAAGEYVLIELPTYVPGRPALERLRTLGLATKKSELELLQVLCASYGEARTHALCGEQVRIGRAPTNEIVLEDATVSTEHATLTWDATQAHWVLADLNSRNGTQANGGAVVAPVALASGSHLLIGDTYVVLHTRAVYERTLEVATAMRAQAVPRTIAAQEP